MNVLFVSNVYPTPCRPGLGTFNVEMVRALRSAGHTVNVVVPVPWIERFRHPAPSASLEWQPDVHHVTYVYPPRVFGASWHLWMWRGIRRTLRSVAATLKPDLILSFWVHPDGACANRIGEELGVPSIVIAGGSDLLVLTGNSRRRRAISATLRGAAAVLAEGRHLANRAIELGAAAATTHIVRRGVDPDRFHPGDKAAARRRLGLPLERPVLLWAGHMVEVKRPDLFVRTIAACNSTKPLGVMVGDGPLRASLLRLAHSLGADNDVRFPGRQRHADLADWYIAADALVLTSDSEGTPNVLQEASACGTPWISTAVGAVRELASSADTVVPIGNVDALAAACEAVIEKPGVTHGKIAHAQSWDDAVGKIVHAVEAAREMQLA